MVTLQMMYTYLPSMNAIFESSPIKLDSWAKIIALAVASYFIVELDKWMRRNEGRKNKNK